MRLAKFIALISLLATLSGCASMASLAIETVDAKISEMRDEKCQLANLVFGRTYCQSTKREVAESEVYCFKTLGGVDCYDRPAPYAAGTTERSSPQAPLQSPARVERTMAGHAPLASPTDEKAAERSAGSPSSLPQTPASIAPALPASTDMRPTPAPSGSLAQR